MTLFALLLSFIIQWQPIQPGHQYIVERRVGSAWQPVDTFTARLDTIPALEGVNIYRGRWIKGEPTETIVAAYIDFSGGDTTPYIVKSANVWQGDTLVYVKTLMSSKYWHCAYTIEGGMVKAIECACDFDLWADGWIDLRDLYLFGREYGVRWNLSDFACFGEMYHKRARKEWR